VKKTTKLEDYADEFDWQPANETEIPSGRRILSFDDFQNSNTARFLPPSKFHENHHAQERLKKQSFEMADKLESLGIDAYQKKAPRMVLYTTVTKQVKEIPQLRNINVFPLIGQKNRRPMLNELEHYITNIDPRAKEFGRYLVITAGQRVKYKNGKLNLRKMEKILKRKLARWREEVLEPLGIECIFQGIEFPGDEEKGHSYHLHANVLIVPPFLHDDGWSQFLHDTHKHFGTHWRDNGKIENLREMCKYPFKPNDVQGADAYELKWLYENTFGMRIFEALGGFREWRRSIKDQGLKVGRIGGKTYLRHPQPPIFNEDPDEDGELKPRDKSNPENIIVGRMTPGFYATLWSEPAVLIMNYNPNSVFEKSRERLLEVQIYSDEARRIWDAKGAPDPQIALAMAKAAIADDVTNVRALWKSDPYIVHNGTISSDEHEVIEETFVPLEDDPPDPPEIDFLSIFDGTYINQKSTTSEGEPETFDLDDIPW